MKKFVLLLSAAAVCCVMLAGCSGGAGKNVSDAAVAEENSRTEEMDTDAGGSENEEQRAADEPAPTTEETAVNVMAIKGPTAMGLVKLMSDAETEALDQNRYQFSIAASPDEVAPKLLQGEADIAAVPANVASVLYHKTEGKIKVLAVNTLGILYIVESGDSVQSVEDLRGKTIYASGKGAVPEYALNYILSGNGIDPEKDVTIEWKAEHTECVAALTARENAIALLPQPFVTTAQLKNESIRTALDLNEEWDKIQGEDSSGALITGVAVARADFIEKNPEAVNSFMDAYKASVDYVNGNIDQAAELIEKYDIVPAAVAKKALPYCNIVFMDGEEMKEKFSGYLSVLMEQNPKSVGGALPEDDFYYNR